MEVLAVDLPQRLSSSTSHSRREIAQKIDQMCKQTMALKPSSEELLNEYVYHQGDPFGNPAFGNSLPLSLPGLLSPVLPGNVWSSLPDAERLQQNLTAFSNLIEYLKEVKRQQEEELNPFASELHFQLELSGRHCLGLVNNLNSVMDSMGFVPSLALPIVPPEHDDVFSMKLTGYRVCRLFRDWVGRSQKDMALLADKYPL